MGRGKKRILIVDSESFVTEGLATHLHDLGYDVEVDFGKGLPDRLSLERFDCIVTELMISPYRYSPILKGLLQVRVDNLTFKGVAWTRTGLELIKKIRAGKIGGSKGTHADVPIVVFTSVVDYGTKETATRDLKVAAYIEKPAVFSKVADEVRALLQ